MKPILDYDFIDHGVCASDYFQGCGVAYTKYDICATGCADSCKEAMEDALDALACSSRFYPQELDRLEAEITEEYEGNPKFTWGVDRFLSDEIGVDDIEDQEEDDSEIYYYFSIRVQEGGLEKEVALAAIS